jgi:uncharacterized surface protein with fasciclin (FAS1) repeats
MLSVTALQQATSSFMISQPSSCQAAALLPYTHSFRYSTSFHCLVTACAVGNIFFYDISTVLMSSSFFYNAPDAFRFYPQWSSASDLYSKAALYSDTLAATVKGQSDSTFLVPNNAALGNAAKALISAPASELVKVMEYHVVGGVRTVPEGWTNGGSVATMLTGRSITSQLSTM